MEKPISDEELALRVYCFLRTWYGNADWFEPYGTGGGGGFIPPFIAEGVRERLMPLMDRFSRSGLRRAVEQGLALSSEERKQKANLIAAQILGEFLPTNVKAEFVDVVVTRERKVMRFIDPEPIPSPVEPDCSDARPITFED